MGRGVGSFRAWYLFRAWEGGGESLFTPDLHCFSPIPSSTPCSLPSLPFCNGNWRRGPGAESRSFLGSLRAWDWSRPWDLEPALADA